jgi:enoyl-CoA hydratase/carnithine racemase
MLDAAAAERIGLVNRVVPRESFEAEWRGLARSLANPSAAEVKWVLAGASADEAVAAFARLWVSDEHWAAADRLQQGRAKS